MTHAEISDTVLGMKKDEDKKKQLGMFIETLKTHVKDAEQDVIDAAILLSRGKMKIKNISARAS